MLNPNEGHQLNWNYLHIILQRIIEIISKIWDLYEWRVM